MTVDPLNDLRRRFVYRSDTTDRWTILGDSDERNTKGDCDDFALTALWLVSDKSFAKMCWFVLTCQAMLWHVRTNSGEPHMALWIKGKGWICNIHQSFGNNKHSLRFPYILPVFLLAYAIKKERD